MQSKRKAEAEFHQPAKNSRVEEVLNRGNNALMQLNEINIKGLDWKIELIHAKFPQRFRATCVFTEPFTGIYEIVPPGMSFFAEGTNKLTCRREIASQIMDRLSDKTIQSTLPMLTEASLVDEILTKSIVSTANEVVRADDSVRLLNEKVSDIEYNFNLTIDGYCCSVSYKGSLFEGKGSSKKVARRNVASQILKTYFNYVLTDDELSQSTSVDSTTTTDTDKLPCNRRKKFSNQIQEMVKKGYEKLVSKLDDQTPKRKMLAGVVISRKLETVFPDYRPDNNDPLQFYTVTGWTINPDDGAEILKLVTISSGTKCLAATESNLAGNCINDSHAEVIAKRALQYFIHRTIERLVYHDHVIDSDPLYGCDILETFSADNHYCYKLKEDVKFHFYVSSSPCGDCRIFFTPTVNTNDTEEETTYYNHLSRSNVGLLRTKIECGEGTLPIKLNLVETWDGILGDERLLTMSCSDKLCTWNVLGLQGALLSNILSEPIYLDSITIGSLFQLDQSQRALCERAKGVTDHCDWSITVSNDSHSQQKISQPDIEPGELTNGAYSVHSFRVNTPYILTVSSQDERIPGKTRISGNWILGENLFEILSPGNGLTNDNLPSRLSKRSLLKSFLTIFKWLPYICPSDGVCHYNKLKSLTSCPDNALGAANYRRKKTALCRYFEQQNLGLWVTKPIERDCLAVKIQG